MGKVFLFVVAFVKVMACNDTTDSFTFYTGLWGYHVYKREWNPYVNQPLKFRQERGNQHDNFAVAGSTRLPGRSVPTTVGHIPREISRYI